MANKKIIKKAKIIKPKLKVINSDDKKPEAKNFLHKEIEPCRICDKPINTLKDEWSSVIEYFGKQQTAIDFYHKKCLTDLINGNVNIIKEKFEDKLKGFVGKMLGGNLRNFAGGFNE